MAGLIIVEYEVRAAHPFALLRQFSCMNRLPPFSHMGEHLQIVDAANPLSIFTGSAFFRSFG